MSNVPAVNASANIYRKDIDGLRAIAVLFVVFYHLRMSWIPSGFVGVDIFFVISGFLITSHICRDIQKNQFSLKTFYLRRMRRILPALMVVLFFSTIAAYFLLLAPDLKNYTDSLLAAVFSIANIYFWKFIYIGYFSTDAKVLPLLHTWSLGVEEQFYLFWPLFLILFFQRCSTRVFFSIIVLVSISSFCLYYCHRSHGQFVYYSFITRAFELLLGALLSFNLIKMPRNQFFYHILSVCGLSLIIYSACFLQSTAYPGFAILLPALGATLLIFTGQRPAVINMVLTCRVLVFIGLISYSLYLWHWPIIAYVNYLGLPIHIQTMCIIIGVSMVCAYASWLFVEQPFRNKVRFNFIKTGLFFWLIPAMLALVFALSVRSVPNFAFNYVLLQAKEAVDNEYYGPIKPESNCHNMTEEFKSLGDPKKCALGKLDNFNTQALIVGDSHAMSNSGMFSLFLKQAGLKGYIATQSGTPFLLDIPLFHSQETKEFFIGRNNLIKNLIEKGSYKYVIMGGAWADPAYGFTDNQAHLAIFKTGLERSIQFIIANKGIPVVLLDFPPLFDLSVNCGVWRLKFEACSNSFKSVHAFEKDTRQVILSLKKLYPSLILIDPSKIICDKTRCYSTINNMPLYFGTGLNSHLNYKGSALIGALYLKKYDNPFKSLPPLVMGVKVRKTN